MFWVIRPLFLCSQAIPMTPIRIKVDPSHDASKVKAEGPGLSRSGESPPPLLGAALFSSTGAQYHQHSLV